MCAGIQLEGCQVYSTCFSSLLLVLRGEVVGKGTNTIVTYLAIGHRIAGYEELRIDVVQIPFEALAAQIVATAREINNEVDTFSFISLSLLYLPQLQSITDVTIVALVIANALIVVLGVVIHPDLGQPY